MVAFIYRCPTTGLRIQGWVADDVDTRANDEFLSAGAVLGLPANPSGESESSGKVVSAGNK